MQHGVASRIGSEVTAVPSPHPKSLLILRLHFRRSSTHGPYGAGAGGVTGGSWSGEGISGGIGSSVGWPGSTRPGAGGVVAGTSSGMGTGVRR